MISIWFILTSLIVVVIPGTGVIYTVATALSGSRKAGVIAAVGCTAGIIPHLAASILGLSAILHTSALVFRIIKIIGIVYLAWLGIGLLRSKGGITVNEGAKEERAFKIISKGVLLNLLNPKLTLFFFSFLPQFIQNREEGYFYQMIILSAFFMGLTLVIFILYGLLAHYFRRFIVSSPRVIRRIQQSFGVIFLGLAVKLALTDD
jgi:threonine/homoserine/homoserine lactone efflux protein